MYTTQTLLSKLQSFQKYKRLLIAFSGGLDSTVLLQSIAALLQCLPEQELLAVHINHGLNTHADAWQAHCQAFCQQLSIPLTIIKVDARAAVGESPEEAARHARYQAFKELLKNGDCLLTAHHQNDQAETLLLQLFRGAGVNGLAAMPEFSPLGKGVLWRPLLEYSREQLQEYAEHQQLPWIEDDSNADLRFDRNFIRQQLMPLLIQRWPSVVTTLNRAAQHQQQALQCLQELAEHDFLQCCGNDLQQLNITELLNLSAPQQINVLRYWFKQCQVRSPNTVKLKQLLTTVLSSRHDAMPLLQWADVVIRRFNGFLFLLKEAQIKWPLTPLIWEFPQPLLLPDGKKLQAVGCFGKGLYIPEHAVITIRFRQGGEKIKVAGHEHHHSLKKLFQQWRVAYWLRAQIPLLYINDQLAAVIGYCESADFQAKSDQQGWLIELSYS